MKTMQKTREKTRKLVVAGMLSAVTMVLGLTPLGIIPIGPLNATILHVPVIIGAVLEGPVVGCVIGLIFGLFSLYRAAVGGSVLAPLFLNPVVTILPRVLIGPVAYYVFRGISHLTRKRALSVGAAAVAGTLTNTIGVMGLIFILYAQQYADLMGISRQGVGLAILSASAVNGIPECILAAVVTVAVVLAVGARLCGHASRGTLTLSATSHKRPRGESGLPVMPITGQPKRRRDGIMAFSSWVFPE